MSYWPGQALPHAPSQHVEPMQVMPRAPFLSRWLLAAVLTLHALLAVAQPVLIGGYLQGDFDLIAAHGVNGSLLPATAFVAAVAAVVFWARRGPGWPVVVLAILWLAEFVQMTLGWLRVLWVHVPLGVAIVGLAVFLAVWAWTPAAGRARRGWWR
jgi:hypothetical protein